MTDPSFKKPVPAPFDCDRLTSLRKLRSNLGEKTIGQLVGDLLSAVDAQALGLPHLYRALSEFYSRYRSLDTSSRTTFLRKGQILWSDTGLASHQRAEATAFLHRYISKVWPKDLPIEFLDLGAGDGRMTLAAIEGLLKGEVLISGVRLIDQNSQAIQIACSRMALVLPASSIHAAVCDFRVIKVPPTSRRSTLVFASAALHELPYKDRANLLRRLAMRVRGLALIELSQDNDFVGPIDCRHALQVGRFYENLIADAYQTVTTNDRWPIIGVFLLGELLQIWNNDYPKRGNFHLTGERWDDALAHAGFVVEARHSSNFLGLTTSYRIAISRDI